MFFAARFAAAAAAAATGLVAALAGNSNKILVG